MSQQLSKEQAQYADPRPPSAGPRRCDNCFWFVLDQWYADHPASSAAPYLVGLCRAVHGVIYGPAVCGLWRARAAGPP